MPYRQDHVEIVVLDLAHNTPLALLPNYPEFPDSCLVDLAFLKNASDILADCANILSEKVG